MQPADFFQAVIVQPPAKPKGANAAQNTRRGSRRHGGPQRISVLPQDEAGCQKDRFPRQWNTEVAEEHDDKNKHKPVMGQAGQYRMQPVKHAIFSTTSAGGSLAEQPLVERLLVDCPTRIGDCQQHAYHRDIAAPGQFQHQDALRSCFGRTEHRVLRRPSMVRRSRSRAWRECVPRQSLGTREIALPEFASLDYDSSLRGLRVALGCDARGCQDGCVWPLFPVPPPRDALRARSGCADFSRLWSGLSF